MNTNDLQQVPGETKPEADTILAALALMERFQQRDFDSVDAIVDSTDPRELVMGLLDVSLIFTDFLAKATGASKEDVVTGVRADVVALVNDGSLGAGISRL